MGKDSAVVGKLGHEKGTNNTNANRGRTLNNEEPLPTLDSMSTVELKDGCGKKAAERVADLLGNVETGNSFSELGLGIPCGEVVYGTGDESEMSLYLLKEVDDSYPGKKTASATPRMALTARS